MVHVWEKQVNHVYLPQERKGTAYISVTSKKTRSGSLV